MFVKFVWKNKHHHLKKALLSGPKAKGGFDLLDFVDLNYTFKVKWLKECLKAPDTLWNFIPHNIFKKVGGLKFLLSSNYSISKLPVKMSEFHQQALLAWKLCYSHNFSPHKSIIWNNECIIKRNKSLYLQNWIDKNIIYLKDLFSPNGQLLSYEDFLTQKTFPVKFNEFSSVINSIPSGILELMKSYVGQNVQRTTPNIPYINGIDILSKKCTNKHIRECFYNAKKIIPRGKFFWNAIFMNINWQKAWLVPFKFCVTNKIRELHLKILHNIYPSKMYISRFLDIDNKCTFCKNELENVTHLFYGCSYSNAFWKELENYISCKTKHKINIEGKNIITYFEYKEKKLCTIVNLYILLGKFHIHKCKFQNSSPSFKLFLIEVDFYFKSLKLITNKKCISVMNIHSEMFNG